MQKDPIFKLSRTNFLFSLFIIGLIALLARVVIGEVLQPIKHHGGMTHTYFYYASNILDHHVYSRSDDPAALTPDSLRMPLYPLLLAAIRVVSGAEQWENWTVAIQYFLGALSCILIGFVAARICNRSTALLAAVLAAFYVDYYYISIIFLREIWALVLLLLLLLFYFRFKESQQSRWGVMAALTFGVGVLNRPELLLVGVFLVAFDWSTWLAFAKRRISSCVLIVLIAAAPLSIWAARNWTVHHHFLPMSSDGAWGFFMGQVYHPEEAYTVADPAAMKMIDEAPSEYAWYQQMNHEAVQAVINHPLRNAHWAVIKIQQTFSEFTNNGMGFLYPALWIGIPLVAFKNHRYKWLATLAGAALAALHLKLGNWDPSRPISLMQVKFSDIIIPGAIGFAALLIRPANDNWKVLAASFLTLIISLVIYIAHLRSRLVLVDWILMIGAAHAIEQLIGRGRTLLTAPPLEG